MRILNMVVVPTMRARLLVIGLIVLSIGVAVATFIFAPNFMQVDRVEIWEWVPAPGFPPGTMAQQFSGYEAIYGGPWYWGILPGIIALAVTLGASLIVASQCKLIREIDA